MKLNKSVASVILSVISAIFFILGLFYSFFVWEILLPIFFLSVGDTADGLYNDSIVCFKVDLER